MVSKKRLQDEWQGPPPMDESWWEAVLAEEEAHQGGFPLKNSGPVRSAAAVKNTAPAKTNGAVYRPRYPSSRPGEGPVNNGMAVERWDTLPSNESEPFFLDWDKALELFEQDQVVRMEVTGCNRGGLLVTGDSLQGFVPISHLIETPCQDNDIEIWLERYMQHTLNLKVIECDQERGRIVFSERAAQARPGSRRTLLQTLRPGICVTGVITNITDFGVFVDLGGVEGLVHVSEISWGRVHHPSDVVKLGQQVEVHVIQIDAERARIALSLKRLYPNPWETAEQRYFPGQVSEATITSIVPFGAFARLEEGLDGLIHISEIGAAGPGAIPSRSAFQLKEGQQVKVRILHVDAARQRLGLSLHLNGEL